MIHSMIDTQPQDPELSALENDVDSALADYERETQLLNTTGREVYAPPELERRRAAAETALADRLDARFGEAEQKAQERLDAARRDLSLLEGDPLERLNPAELQRASYLAPFVRESVASLPVATLTTELERRRLSGDKTLIALWLRYAAPALEEAQLAAAAQGRGLDRDGRALADELERSRVALIDEATGKKLDAARSAEKGALTFRAGVRRIRAKDPREQARIRQTYGVR